MLKKVLISVGIVVAVVAAAVLLWPKSEHVIGSVPIANEYHSTTTFTATGAGMYVIASNTPAVLGSVTVVSSSLSQYRIWNATSTIDYSSTTVALLKPSIAEGTYTFDAVMPKGMIIQVPTGFTGVYVVTYRQL